MRAANRASVAWTTVIVVASLIGIGSLAAMRVLVDDHRVMIYAACALPFVIGLIAALGTMEPRTRILLLWLAAAISGFVAVLTVMGGAGLIVLLVMIVYLLAAWMLNEASGTTDS